MNIFIAEDAPVVRERLIALIEELGGMTVVGHSASVADSVGQIARLQPEIALLDVRLSDGTAFDIIARLKAMALSIRTILISADCSAHYRARAAQLGVLHFFDKTREFELIGPTLIRLGGGVR